MIYTDTDKPEGYSSFYNHIQSPVCVETLEYATFSIQPSDYGQCGSFQEYLSDSLV